MIWSRTTGARQRRWARSDGVAASIDAARSARRRSGDGLAPPALGAGGETAVALAERSGGELLLLTLELGVQQAALAGGRAVCGDRQAMREVWRS